MPDGARALRRARDTAVVAAVALPLVTLVVQGVADEWRGPSLLPQRLGTRGFATAFDEGAGGALATSLAVALAATALALALGWPAARALGERRLRHPGLVLLVLGLPLLVPGYATGVGLTEWFVRLGLIDTLGGLVLAHLVVVLPYVVLALVGGFTPSLRQLEEQARTLGLTPARLLLLVTVPALRPALVTAVALGFLVSWGQYGLSLAVGLPTLPVVLLPYVRVDPEVAAALATLAIVPPLLALVATARLTRRPL
ncbi:MAG: ABC transporter permease [Thermoleophilia bacterium]